MNSMAEHLYVDVAEIEKALEGFGGELGARMQSEFAQLVADFGRQMPSRASSM